MMHPIPLTRQDRTVGIALLVLGLPLLLVPNFRIGAMEIDPFQMGMPWVLAAILLLTTSYAARPNPRLVRWGAAILFAMGLLSPFIINLINSSLGA